MVAGVQMPFTPERPGSRDPRRVFLGLDLGTTFGWALVDDEGRRVDSGVWHFSAMRREHPGARWVRASQQLSSFLGKLLTDEATTLGGIGYEKVIGHTADRAAQVYGAFEAIMLAVTFQCGIDLDPITVSQLKLVATGHGGGKLADKTHVMVAARRRWPHLDIDAAGADNEADALWISDIMRRRVLGVRW